MISNGAGLPTCCRRAIQDIEQPRIDRVHLTAAEITQQMVDAQQRVGNVPAGFAVFEIERFAGMGVMKGQASGAGGRMQQPGPDHDRCRKGSKGKKSPPAGFYTRHFRTPSEGQRDAVDCFRRSTRRASLKGIR